MGAALASDNVCLPLVGVDGGAACSLQRGESAEVGTVAVRDRDPFHVSWLAAEAANRLQDKLGVAFKERVDQRQLADRLDQKRAYVAALAVAEPVDAACEFFHSPLTRQGANGLATACRAGSRSGKWRRSSVRIELRSTQSIPSLV